MRFLVGDVFARMADIPDASVDLIVTSPPFLALRSYLPDGHPQKHLELGAEPTPAAYLTTLLALTREWRRILTPHGSICVELGDTYSGNGGAGGDYGPVGLREGPTFDGAASRQRTPGGDARGSRRLALGDGPPRRDIGPGWPLPKSLCLIPTSYAWALAYGYNPHNPDDTLDPWRVRNLIVWHRPNPPVGALGDKVRPSTSYITTACVSDKRWFDLDAERTEPGPIGGQTVAVGKPTGSRNDDNLPHITANNPAGAPPLDCWIDGDVWTIPTHPYKGAHYATYPPALPRRLIRLMCPMHVCTTCGEPRRRITEDVGWPIRAKDPMINDGGKGGGAHGNRCKPDTTLGWSDCGHDTWRRGHVLDPFGGSGTTGQAAIDTGRDTTLIDLDSRNLELARQRLGLFLDDEPEMTA